MWLERVADRLQTKPEVLERESLRAYLEKKLFLTEAELLMLGHKYGVKTVFELDKAIQQGRFHEDKAFEDYFQFDYLEHERDVLRQTLEELP